LRVATVVLLAPLAAAAQQGATIERVTGTVTIAAPNEPARPARENDSVREGETITTEQNSEALVRTADNSRISMRANSQLVLAESRYAENDADSLVLRLAKGSLRAVTGLLAKRRPRSVSFTAITSTIGIRGTDFELSVHEEDTPDTRAGVYNYVHEGTTNIALASGESADVPAESTGIALLNPKPGEPALQVIRGRPAFLRGGGFDALMMQIIQQPRVIPMPPRVK
jgi:hypothetical protein